MSAYLVLASANILADTVIFATFARKKNVMREILNPWIGNHSGYNCFGCNPTNPMGMQMHFFWDDEKQNIISVWRANKNFVSWIDTLHGGIQASLLDEICGWVVFYKLQTSGVTAKMEMRYRKQILTTWPYITLQAKLEEQRRNIAIVKGKILNPNEEVCAECTCTYFIFDSEKSKEMGYLPALLGDKEFTKEDIIEQMLAQIRKPRKPEDFISLQNF